MLSLMPRCDGQGGSKGWNDRPVAIRSWAYWATSASPGLRSATREVPGQRRDRLGNRVTDRLSAVAGEARSVLHQWSTVVGHRRKV